LEVLIVEPSDSGPLALVFDFLSSFRRLQHRGDDDYSGAVSRQALTITAVAPVRPFGSAAVATTIGNEVLNDTQVINFGHAAALIASIV
jgi:hypothetical protein